MKKRTLISLSTMLAALVAVFIITQGCEDDPDTGGTSLDNYFANNPYVSDPRGGSGSDVIVTPSSVTLTAEGEEFLFTARGGDGDYTWERANTSLGTLTPQNGNDAQAIYKVTKLKQNNIIVYDEDGDAAIVDLNYTAASVTITPTAQQEIAPTNGLKITFSASGGTPPYTWDMQDHSLGVFESTGSGLKTGTYTSSAGTGTNKVWAVDDIGDVSPMTTIIQK